SPEHPFPSPHQVRKELAREGLALTERLCVYPRYIDPEWISPAVLDTIKRKYWRFIPRRGSGRTAPPAPIRPGLVAGADEPGRGASFSQPAIPPAWMLEDHLGWLRLAKQTAPQLHLHADSPMEVAHMCDTSGLPPLEVFARLREAGLGSTPGTAAEVLHDGVRARISPNKLPVARWVEIIEASHEAGLRSSATVMFGHIEEPWELAEHMRVVRELQERTGGVTEFVPLSFIPFHTLLGRT